jgi:hypothetical protein
MTELRQPAKHGSEKRQRTKLVQVRCTEGEYAVLSTQADRAGMTIGALVRLKTIGTPGPRALRRPPFDYQVLAKLCGLLGRSCGNLNQIAKVLNCGEAPPHNIAEAVAEIRAIGKMLLDSMGRKGRD